MRGEYLFGFRFVGDAAVGLTISNENELIPLFPIAISDIFSDLLGFGRLCGTYYSYTLSKLPTSSAPPHKYSSRLPTF